MGNSRSRHRGTRATQGNGGGERNNSEVELDVQRIAELLFLRQELEQRQEAIRNSLDLRRSNNPTNMANAAPAAAGEQPARTRSNNETAGGEESPNFRRSFLRRFLQHHLLLEYLERNPDLLSDDDEDNNNGSDSDDASSLASSTYEGLSELFENEEALAAETQSALEEERLRQRAEKVQAFRTKVSEIFDSQKEIIAKKISAAMDVQLTLRDLLRDQSQALNEKDEARLISIQSLVDEIHGSDGFVDQQEIGTLGRDLDLIADNVSMLKELTSVRDEDEVLCTVCLTCPTGIIYDCIRCDHLVCQCCKARITSCPTCRVRFRNKAPRRNRWAEKLARLQREMTAVCILQEEAS